MCTNLNYWKCVFCFCFCVVAFQRSAVGLKLWAITAGIKKYNSIIKKKSKKHDNIKLMAKAKLNTMKVMISKLIIDSCINHDEFVPVSNVFREYKRMIILICCVIYNIKTKPIKLVARKILGTKILVLKKLSKID